VLEELVTFNAILKAAAESPGLEPLFSSVGGQVAARKVTQMEANDVRRKLLAFTGIDGYRKFIRALNGTGRLKGRFRFWQEDLLHEAGFSAA
jgi:hypothetical protein